MTHSFAIQLIDVVKAYSTAGQIALAIDHLRLDVPQGQFIAITGRSGSGKSTLLNLLAGIDTVTSGQILIDGQDISRLSDDALTCLRRERIGVVYQFYNLLSTLTVHENVMLPALLDGKRESDIASKADALLDEVGMSHRRDARPYTLSGGELQRAALARALVQAPAILLADEPTGNLDSKTADQVIRMLYDLGKAHHTTIALVTHNPEAAAVADRLIELLDGRMVKDERK